jgi:predicted ABC-type ATPase
VKSPGLAAQQKALAAVTAAQRKAGKPLAVLLAGHNGSGKSTLWYEGGLAKTLKLPLINADRMMLSVLPERDRKNQLPKWAAELRDTDASWMAVAQKSVDAFVAQAMGQKVPFAMETVFSYLETDSDGRVTASKIDLIHQMQDAGYFVLLVFVGLSNVNLSVGRVQTRKKDGGHDVPVDKLRTRFPKTQRVMKLAMEVADACLLYDNSRDWKKAFTVCRVQIGATAHFDIRRDGDHVPTEIKDWLPIVSPLVS